MKGRPLKKLPDWFTKEWCKNHTAQELADIFNCSKVNAYLLARNRGWVLKPISRTRKKKKNNESVMTLGSNKDTQNKWRGRLYGIIGGYLLQDRKLKSI